MTTRNKILGIVILVLAVLAYFIFKPRSSQPRNILPASHLAAESSATPTLEFSIAHADLPKPTATPEVNGFVEVTALNPDLVYYFAGSSHKVTAISGWNHEWFKFRGSDGVIIEAMCSMPRVKLPGDGDPFHYDIKSMNLLADADYRFDQESGQYVPKGNIASVQVYWSGQKVLKALALVK